MIWPHIPPDRRKRVLDLLRELTGLRSTTQRRSILSDDAHAAIEALENIAALQDLRATEARLLNKVAIAAADRCYQRAMSRVAQIKDAPHARDVLWIKAGEARAAGDDVMRAAGLDPRDHPRAAELMEKRVP